MNRIRRVSTVFAAMMTLFIVTGCSSATRENNTMKDAFAELLKRPNLTQAEAGHQAMYQTIRERLVAEVGVATWAPDEDPVRGVACGGDLARLAGSGKRLLLAGNSTGNLPDAKWDQAVTIVTEVAKKHGFGAPGVIVDGPGNHEVSFRDTYDGELLFGTGPGATVLSGSTGCHLTEEAYHRGTYLPNKEY
jgi:hypothetical protein